MKAFTRMVVPAGEFRDTHTTASGPDRVSRPTHPPVAVLITHTHHFCGQVMVPAGEFLWTGDEFRDTHSHTEQYLGEELVKAFTRISK